MDYKALVMDIDGTLYNSKKKITAATRQAIFKAREAGKIIVIASGRPLPGIRDVCETLCFTEKGGYKTSSESLIFMIYSFSTFRDL